MWNECITTRAEAQYSVNNTKRRNKICLNLRYNVVF